MVQRDAGLEPPAGRLVAEVVEVEIDLQVDCSELRCQLPARPDPLRLMSVGFEHGCLPGFLDRAHVLAHPSGPREIPLAESPFAQRPECL